MNLKCMTCPKEFSCKQKIRSILFFILEMIIVFIMGIFIFFLAFG